MKNWYLVSFEYVDNVYCTNLCIAENKADVEKYYSAQYDRVSVENAAAWEVNMYKKRGMPVVTL